MTVRHARFLLVALHVPMVVIPIWFTGLGVMDFSGRDLLLAVAAGLAIGGLQLRHSLAATRDERPRGWKWTLLVLIGLVYPPMWLLGWGETWSGAQLCAMASTLMLMRGWERTALFSGMALFSVAFELANSPLRSPMDTVFALLNGLISPVPSLIVYLATRLVRVLDELESTKAELADAVVGRERLRLSRDLHDLFGQSLSAISLKGDLALRLLPTDPPAARAEVAGLTRLARDTLRRMRAISRNEHAVSLHTEIDGASALLGTAGIRTTIDVATIDVASPDLPAARQVFAWAVREGVTNILRHSEATLCSITVTRQAGTARLVIVNDGFRAPTQGEGNGLTGLATRVRALGGAMTAERAGDEFRLVVEIPEETP